MENVSLKELNANVIVLQKLVEKMSEIILENSLELSDEVVAEIGRSRERPRSEFISHEDVVAEFLDGN